MILWKWNSCFFCRTRLVPLSCCLGKISLSLLFPAPLQSWGEFQPSQCWVKMCFEITAHFWEVYGYTVCSVFCKICDPSQIDKLFEQLKQDHIHTLPVTWVQAFVPHHFVLLFICVPTERGNVEKQGSVSLPLWMFWCLSVVFIWRCRAFPYFLFSWVHEHAPLSFLCSLCFL